MFLVRASPDPPPKVFETAPDLLLALRNVRLAKEYVQGIVLLVDTSRRFHTPLPHPAFKNLHYLERLLDQTEQVLAIKPEAAHPYAEFHASPSDISVPYG